jgi:hypothetical protein
MKLSILKSSLCYLNESLQVTSFIKFTYSVQVLDCQLFYMIREKKLKKKFICNIFLLK